jgi:type VI secretion system protein ImpJ
MMLGAKVLWSEGLQLSPQQFQQQDLYHETRLQRIAAALNPCLWGVVSATWDAAAMRNNSLHATAMSLIFQDGEVYEASDTEKLPPPVDLGALPLSEQQFTYYAAIPRLNNLGDNLSRSNDDGAARYAQRDGDTPDLMTDAITTPVLFLQKNVRLLLKTASRDAYFSFPIVRIRREDGGGFEVDPTFFPPAVSSAAVPGLTALLDSLLSQLQVKVETIYGRHRQSSKDDFEIQNGDISSYLMLNTITSACATLAHSARYRYHHPELIFDKLSTLAGGLLALSRRYSLGGFPHYQHDDAAEGFFKLDAMIRDLIDVSFSNKYRLIPLVRDAERTTRYDAALADVDERTVLGLAVSADMPALELVAAVPLRFKVGSPKSIEELVRHALSGVKLIHMTQVPAAVPVRPNTHYFSLDSKSALYESVLKMQALSMYVPAGMEGLKIELFSLTA